MMPHTQRPKYLQDLDLVQDALVDHPDGLTTDQLMEITGRHRTAIQQATTRLRNDGKIHSTRAKDRVVTFFDPSRKLSHNPG